MDLFSIFITAYYDDQLAKWLSGGKGRRLHRPELFDAQAFRKAIMDRIRIYVLARQRDLRVYMNVPDAFTQWLKKEVPAKTKVFVHLLFFISLFFIYVFFSFTFFDHI